MEPPHGKRFTLLQASPISIPAMDIRKAMEPNSDTTLSIEVAGIGGASSNGPSPGDASNPGSPGINIPPSGDPLQRTVLGTSFFRLGQEPWILGRDMKSGATTITALDQQTRKPILEFAVSVSTKNAARLLEVFSKPHNALAKERFQTLFKKIFEKRKQEGRPIFFEQGVVDELCAFGGKWGPERKKLAYSEFLKVLERYQELPPNFAALTRQGGLNLPECLFKAGLRCDLAAMEQEREARHTSLEELPLVVEVFVATYFDAKKARGDVGGTGLPDGSEDEQVLLARDKWVKSSKTPHIPTPYVYGALMTITNPTRRTHIKFKDTCKNTKFDLYTKFDLINCTKKCAGRDVYY